MMMLHDESEPWTYIFSDDRDDAAPPAPIVRRVIFIERQCVARQRAREPRASRLRGWLAAAQRSERAREMLCPEICVGGLNETAKIVIGT